MLRKIELTQQFIPGQEVEQILPQGDTSKPVKGIVSATHFNITYKYNRHKKGEGSPDIAIIYTILSENELGSMEEHTFFERELKPVAKNRLELFRELLINELKRIL
jgi:hypothetical protein